MGVWQASLRGGLKAAGPWPRGQPTDPSTPDGLFRAKAPRVPEEGQSPHPPPRLHRAALACGSTLSSVSSSLWFSGHVLCPPDLPNFIPRQPCPTLQLLSLLRSQRRHPSLVETLLPEWLCSSCLCSCDVSRNEHATSDTYQR